MARGSRADGRSRGSLAADFPSDRPARQNLDLPLQSRNLQSRNLLRFRLDSPGPAVHPDVQLRMGTGNYLGYCGRSSGSDLQETGLRRDGHKGENKVKLTIVILVLMSLGLYAQAPAAPPAAPAPVAQAPRPTPISPGGLEALKAMDGTLKPLQDDLVVLQKAVAGFQKDQQELVNLTLSLILNAECAKAG